MGGSFIKNQTSRFISFSLYGTDDLYIFGALQNAKFINERLRNWKAVFYCGPDISDSVIRELSSERSVVKRFDLHWHENGMMWRYNIIQESDFDFAVFRDVDSRISSREIGALQEWEASGKFAHIMRDHPAHQSRILGGMWGIRKPSVEFKRLLDLRFNYETGWGQDQKFLNQVIYPAVQNDLLVHDSFFCYELNSKHFPTNRFNFEFVGETIDSNNNVDNRARRELLRYEKSFLLKIKLKVKTFLIALHYRIKKNY